MISLLRASVALATFRLGAIISRRSRNTIAGELARARSKKSLKANYSGQSGNRVKLLTARGLSEAFGVTVGWVYTRTKKDAVDPLPVVRFGRRGIRFDPYKISTYIRARERHPVSATLESPSGSAPIEGKGHFKLKRKRVQTGSVRLREDVDPAWWEGFYREDVITEAGKKVRRRSAVNLGTVKEIRSKKAALQKLAVILEPINQVKCRPKTMMTFRGFIEK
jgi:hypothetical protein